MRLKPEQLSADLHTQLRPIYLLCGDEPLQQGEAADEIRQSAREAGYSVREVLNAEIHFDWNRLTQEADSFSIFAERKIIDLRVPSGKPGTEGSKALLDYCDRPPADTLLLITSGKLSPQAQKSRWFQALDRAGAVVQTWPLQGAGLLEWLRRRSEKLGLQISTDGLKLLASRTEGNLLAAAQEIEKLFILHGGSELAVRDIEQAVADSARFDPFQLLDSLLSSRAKRAARILHSLKAEGVGELIILWAISRETRMLLSIKKELERGGRADAAMAKHQVWEKRRPLVAEALKRLSPADLEDILLLCGRADRQLKGQSEGDGWETLTSACLRFCARPIMAETF